MYVNSAFKTDDDAAWAFVAERGFGAVVAVEDGQPVASHVPLLVTGQGSERLYHAVPSSRTLMKRLAEQGGNLGAMTSVLLSLLGVAGNEALERVVAEAVRLERFQPRAIRHLLDQDRRARGAPLLPSLPITTDTRLTACVVQPHSLAAYDALLPKGNDHDRR